MIGLHFIEYMIIAALFLLLPLIPSVYIYKTFPKDKIKMKGVLGAFTINATGGFAGYLICCLFLYFFVLQGYMQYLKEENFVSNDRPAFVSDQVLTNYNWSAEYSPETTPEWTWRSKIDFAKDNNGMLVLSGITQRRNSKGENVDIIEWKSDPFTFPTVAKNFEIPGYKRWLKGEEQFDSTIKYEVDKWEKGKFSFKSDYLLRGEFVPDARPSEGWGLWLVRPPQ